MTQIGLQDPSDLATPKTFDSLKTSGNPNLEILSNQMIIWLRYNGGILLSAVADKKLLPDDLLAFRQQMMSHVSEKEKLKGL